MSRTALAFSLAFQGRMDEALPLLEETKAEDAGWRENLLLKWEPAIPWLTGHFSASLASRAGNHGPFPRWAERREAWGVAFAALFAVETDELMEARKYLLKSKAAYDNRNWLMFSDWAPYAEAVLAWREGRTADARWVSGTSVPGSSKWEPGLAAFVLVDLGVGAEVEDPGLSERSPPTSTAALRRRLVTSTGAWQPWAQPGRTSPPGRRPAQPAGPRRR